MRAYVFVIWLKKIRSRIQTHKLDLTQAIFAINKGITYRKNILTKKCGREKSAHQTLSSCNIYDVLSYWSIIWISNNNLVFNHQIEIERNIEISKLLHSRRLRREPCGTGRGINTRSTESKRQSARRTFSAAATLLRLLSPSVPATTPASAHRQWSELASKPAKAKRRPNNRGLSSQLQVDRPLWPCWAPDLLCPVCHCLVSCVVPPHTTAHTFPPLNPFLTYFSLKVVTCICAEEEEVREMVDRLDKAWLAGSNAPCGRLFLVISGFREQF